MSLHFLHKNKFLHLFILSILIIFNLNCHAEMLEFKVVQDVSYVTGKLNAAGYEYNVSFLIDVGMETSFCFLCAYEGEFKQDKKADYIFETDTGNKFSAKDASFAKCTDNVKSIIKILNTTGYPVVGIIGANLFSDKIIYDFSNKIIYYDNVEFPDNYDMSFDYKSNNGFACFKDTLQNENDYTFSFKTTTYLCQLSNDILLSDGNDGKIVFDHLGSINYAYKAADNSNLIRESFSDIKIGNNYLKDYLLFIDKEARQFHLTHNSGTSIDILEFEFNNAINNNDYNAIKRYFDRCSESLLASQRIDLILDKIFRGEITDLSLYKSVLDALVRLYSEEHAIRTIILKVDKYILDESYSKNIIKILETSKLYVREFEVSPYLVSDIDYSLGIIFLHQNELKKGYTQLLSALFVNPSKSNYNFALGNYFLKKGLFVRARSRFMKACIGDDYNDDYLEQIETVCNDTTFTNLFMKSDDRPKYLTKVHEVEPKIEIIRSDFSDIVSIEVYHYAYKRQEENLSKLFSNIMKRFEFENLLFVNYQFKDLVDYPFGYHQDESLMPDISDCPAIIVINGDKIYLHEEDIINQELGIQKLLDRDRSFIPCILEGNIIRIADEIKAVEIDISKMPGNKPVEAELLFFNGFSFYDNYSGSYRWTHRNMLVAIERTELEADSVYSIKEFPDNFYIWQRNNLNTENKELLKNDETLNAVFTGRSFLIVKFYDADKKCIAYAKVNFIDESRAYYEYF